MLNENQQTAVNSNGNILVVASAGSGKTTVITERAKRLISDGVDPSSILLITFSKKSKEALIERLDNDEVNIETFHSMALKVVQDKYRYRYKVWTPQYEKENVIKEILKVWDYPEDNNHIISDALRFIEKQKLLMLKPTDALNYRDFDMLTKKEYQYIYNYYESYKERNNLIEFSDFLNMAYDIFNEDKAILNKYQNKYKYIMVDEYQDINKGQHLVLRQLNQTETMAVGDPLQAIYGFRGGVSAYILNYDREYENTKVINLNTNYRCKNEIVLTSNAFAKRYISDTKHHNYVESIANRQEKATIEVGLKASETQWVVDKIKSENLNYKDTAILARTNAQLQIIQRQLGRNMIPFSVVGGSIYTELPEIKLILSYLRVASNVNDNDSFLYLYNKPNRWLGKAFLNEVMACKGTSYYKSMDGIARREWKFKKGINEIYKVIGALQNNRFESVREMVKYIRKTLSLDNYFDHISDDSSYIEKVENMDAFEESCSKYKTIQELLTELGALDESEETENRVNIMTIHKSKGLEFDNVFIIGLDSKHMPHSRCENEEEEAKIFYVGLTRAKDNLYLSTENESTASKFLLSLMKDSKLKVDRE